MFCALHHAQRKLSRIARATCLPFTGCASIRASETAAMILQDAVFC
jgi:hypothetical protein